MRGSYQSSSALLTSRNGVMAATPALFTSKWTGPTFCTAFRVPSQSVRSQGTATILGSCSATQNTFYLVHGALVTANRENLSMFMTLNWLLFLSLYAQTEHKLSELNCIIHCIYENTILEIYWVWIWIKTQSSPSYYLKMDIKPFILPGKGLKIYRMHWIKPVALGKTNRIITI